MKRIKLAKYYIDIFSLCWANRNLTSLNFTIGMIIFLQPKGYWKFHFKQKTFYQDRRFEKRRKKDKISFQLIRNELQEEDLFTVWIYTKWRTIIVKYGCYTLYRRLSKWLFTLLVSFVRKSILILVAAFYNVQWLFLQKTTLFFHFVSILLVRWFIEITYWLKTSFCAQNCGNLLRSRGNR